MKSKKYSMVYCLDPPGDDPSGEYDVARVIEKESQEIVIVVLYIQVAYKAFGYHFSAQKSSDGLHYAVIIDDLYFDLLKKNKPVFEAMVMHELGHILNGDLEKNLNGEEIRDNRILQIMKGKVAEEELSADRFAVEHCGKNNVMRMLDNLIDTRKKRNTVDLQMALDEFELRKKAVSKL